MMLRVLAVSAVLLSLAPFQCRHDPEVQLRREDTPGDALWDLSESFRAKGDASAADTTLRFLLEKYPSSRYAPAARERLGGPPVTPASSAPKNLTPQKGDAG